MALAGWSSLFLKTESLSSTQQVKEDSVLLPKSSPCLTPEFRKARPSCYVVASLNTQFPSELCPWHSEFYKLHLNMGQIGLILNQQYPAEFKLAFKISNFHVALLEYLLLGHSLLEINPHSVRGPSPVE